MYSTDHKNYIENFFKHFQSKLLDLQKSLFCDIILEINYFLKGSYQKTFFTKVLLPKLIFFNDLKKKKIRIFFDIEKWLWKSEFCNSAGLITSTENVQKNSNAIFVISEKVLSNSVDMVKKFTKGLTVSIYTVGFRFKAIWSSMLMFSSPKKSCAINRISNFTPNVVGRYRVFHVKVK